MSGSLLNSRDERVMRKSSTSVDASLSLSNHAGLHLNGDEQLAVVHLHTQRGEAQPSSVLVSASCSASSDVGRADEWWRASGGVAWDVEVHVAGRSASLKSDRMHF